MEFKDLTFPKKIEHIWEYYKVHIFGTLLFLFIAVTWFYNAKLAPHKELVAGVGILNYKLPEFYEDPLYPVINDALGLKDTNAEVRIEFFDASDSEAGMDIVAKFGAMLLSGDVTVLVMDEATMEAYAYEDYLLDLTTVYTKEEISKMEDENLILSYSTETVPEVKPYAICLKNSTLMKRLPEYDTQDKYIAIFGAVEDKKNPKRVVDALID